MPLSTIDTSSISGLGYGFKNRIINGAMMIDQRNAGASVTNVAGAIYTVDRWLASGSQASKFTGQQSTTAPTGFKNSLACTSSSAYSVGTAETFAVQHRIEGFNVADLGWGTAGASTVTLSFWVRSSLTGTFGGSLRNSAADRSYPFSYTINSANTWEQKSVTIAGDISGTWLTDNGIGITLIFSLGAGATLSGTAGSWAGANYLSATGATSVVGTSGATFYITGVQLEKGNVATSFDYRPYGTELPLCQRYFNTVKAINGTSGGTNNGMFSNVGYAEMRTTPTFAVTGALVITDPGNAAYTQSSGNVSVAGGQSSSGAFLAFGNFSGLPFNRSLMLNTNTTYLTLNAEL